jgi:Acetyltransferase (isoleucine patch superfamily)
VSIYGLKHISTTGLLEVATDYIGFMSRYDRTLLNVSGTLVVNGYYSIGRGCRFDIGPNAVAEFGRGYVNPNTTFVIMNGITVGNDCAISWGCQFLDEDFHTIEYEGKRKRPEKKIRIGDHVWIGCNVTVLPGATIPDGCVVAANSVVKSAFSQKQALIAGNPAKIVKENVRWQ